jgi:serine/threonine protein kinase
LKNFNKPIWSIGDIVSGKYEVLQVMRGGMGLVYAVRDLNYSTKDGQPEIMIAKTFLPELAGIPGINKRFIEEAKIWINMAPHKNVLRAYFVDIFFDTPYVFADFVEEHVLPNTLTGWIQKKITPPEVALFFFMQIVDGLSNAYENNVAFHGDLKPNNILIDKTCTVRVADWGLSHFKEKQTVNNIIEGVDCIGGSDVFPQRGTPGYAAPELMERDIQPTQAIDVFSLGVILGEMLTGNKFPAGPSQIQIQDALKSCFALDPSIQVILAKVITEFLCIDSDLRVKQYEENINLLCKVFVKMTDLRLLPPYFTVRLFDRIRARKIANSMEKLGVINNGTRPIE